MGRVGEAAEKRKLSSNISEAKAVKKENNNVVIDYEEIYDIPYYMVDNAGWDKTAIEKAPISNKPKQNSEGNTAVQKTSNELLKKSKQKNCTYKTKQILSNREKGSSATNTIIPLDLL